jgi:membrane-associated phospholipid phosphatase
MVELFVGGIFLLLLAVIGIAWEASHNKAKILGWDAAPDPTTICTKRFFLVCVLLFGGFLLVSWATHLSSVQSFDRAFLGMLVHYVQDRSGPFVIHAMNTIPRIGDFDLLVYGVLWVALVLWVRRQVWSLWFVCFMILGSFGLELFFKIIFHRLRPVLVFAYHLSSYPSGQTLRAAAFAGALLVVWLPFCRRSWQRVLLWSAVVVWPIFAGTSLIYHVTHTLTDVIGGMLLGTAWLCACVMLLEQVSCRQAKARSHQVHTHTAPGSSVLRFCSCFGGINSTGTDPFHLRRVPTSSCYESPYHFGCEAALRAFGALNSF